MLNNKIYTKCMSLSQNGLHLIYILFIYGLLSLLQPVYAAVVVTGGAGQNIPAGAESEDIVFSVVDEQGNPITGASVDFSVTDPATNSIEDGLTVLSAEQDVNGQVATRFKGSGNLGNYTVTATFATDPTQFATVDLLVIIGAPAELSIVEGDGQTVETNKNSDDIIFELKDAFGNVITTGQAVNFTLTAPFSEPTNTGIFPTDDVSDIDGQVTTRLEPVAAKGDYTIAATLATDNTIIASTSINVVEPPSELPILGAGAAVNTQGLPIDTTASFNGGIKVGDADSFVKSAELKATDSVLIQGMINVASADIGKPADILVVGAHTLPGFGLTYYMVDSNNNPQIWDSGMADLVSFTRIESLPTIQSVNMYGGRLPPGVIDVYFGYRLDDGTIVYNGVNIISANIQ